MSFLPSSDRRVAFLLSTCRRRLTGSARAPPHGLPAARDQEQNIVQNRTSCIIGRNWRIHPFVRLASGRIRGFLDRESTCDEKARNKTRSNLLKTNDSAKSLDFVSNDFNDLPSLVRNARFRLAKRILSLSLFFASSTQETETGFAQASRAPKPRTPGDPAIACGCRHRSQAGHAPRTPQRQGRKADDSR